MKLAIYDPKSPKMFELELLEFVRKELSSILNEYKLRIRKTLNKRLNIEKKWLKINMILSLKKLGI